MMLKDSLMCFNNNNMKYAHHQNRQIEERIFTDTTLETKYDLTKAIDFVKYSDLILCS